jgi:hypothetical protein
LEQTTPEKYCTFAGSSRGKGFPMATADTACPIADRPLVIVGMHRSGTSLAASLAAAAGVDLGPRQLGPGTGNPRGHYEDLDFLELHQRILRANGGDEDGFACSGRLRLSPGLAEDAAKLVAARRAERRAWGWKDPRTTLLLDLYQPLLPRARYLCVFRRPWEVVDSLLRRGHVGDRLFAERPELAPQLWHHYNRRLLDLVDRHPDRCLVVESHQLADEPDRIVRGLEQLLEVELTMPERLFDPRLMRRDDASPRALLVDAVCPEATQLYRALRRRAGVEGSLPEGLGGGKSRAEIASAGLVEWAAHERRTREAIAAGEHVGELSAALETAHAACDRAHAALRTVTNERDALAEHGRQLDEHGRRLADDNAALADHIRSLQRHLDSLQEHIAAQQRQIESCDVWIRWLEHQLAELR